MLKTWKIMSLLILLLGLVTVVGCSDDDPIIGTWKLYSVDGEIVNDITVLITFKEDDSYKMTDSGDGYYESETGSYSTAGSTLTVNPVGDDSWTSTYAISGDNLTITDEDEVALLKRQ